MYGGDIKFKNMDSFVKQAQFEKIISIDDFDYDQRGEKWGVHDQYTFERLVITSYSIHYTKLYDFL